MTNICPPEYIALAHRLADAARAVVRGYFRQPFEVEQKRDTSLVTIADREAESAMREIITEAVPEHGVEGEEHGAHNLDAEWVWQLDPIDGTNSFVSGTPLFGTLIGLVHQGRAVLGLMDQPILAERWLAHGQETTTLNDTPCQVRPCPRLADAVHFTSGPEYFANGLQPVLGRLVASTRLTRYSADCYAVGLLVGGHIDLVVETGLQAHDYAALVPIVENAGGVCSNWRGQRHDMSSDDDFIAAGDPALHAQVLEIVNR